MTNNDSRVKNRQISRRQLLAVVSASSMIGVAGCTSSNSSGKTLSSQSTNDSGGPNLNKIVPEKPIGKGPHGHDITPPDKLKLSDQENKKIKNGNFTISVVYHYLKTDWTRLHRIGLEKQAKQLGIDIEGVYGAQMKASKQINILNTLASKAGKIDAIISLPTDIKATTNAYMNVSKKGISVIFEGNVPNDMKYPDDYVGCVGVDNKALGLVSGRLLAYYVGKGSIGKLNDAKPFFVADQREKGAKMAFENKSDINIKSENSFTDADKTYTIIQNMLTANPDLKGVWTPWAQPPGMQAVKAADTAGRNEFTVTSTDLAKRQAVNMAKGGFLKGLSVGDPIKIGKTNVNMTGKALIGKDTPPYSAVRARAVTRDNLRKIYPKILQTSVPKAVSKYYNSSKR